MPLYIPITKLDAAQRLVYGTLTEEIADKTGEILDYVSSRPAFESWTQQFYDASGGKSLGNVRAMHGALAAGKLTSISFDDENKRIEGVAKIIDDDAWNKVVEGVYTGFSIGGGYAKRWKDEENPSLMRYTPTLSEVSLVDNPAVPTATFSLIKNSDDDQANMNDLAQQLEWLKENISLPGEILDYVDALLDFLAGEASGNTDKRAPSPMQKMQVTIAQLQQRIITLESQPLPAKGILRALSKGDDYAHANEQTDLSKLSSSQRAQHLIKDALAKPTLL